MDRPINYEKKQRSLVERRHLLIECCWFLRSSWGDPWGRIKKSIENKHEKMRKRKMKKQKKEIKIYEEWTLKTKTEWNIVSSQISSKNKCVRITVLSLPSTYILCKRRHIVEWNTIEVTAETVREPVSTTIK